MALSPSTATDDEKGTATRPGTSKLGLLSKDMGILTSNVSKRSWEERRGKGLPWEAGK